MEINIVHYFDFNVEEFEKLTSDLDQDRYVKEMPNLAKREEIEKIEDEKYVKTKVRNFAIGFIPEPVRPFLKPHMLSWVEETIWDKENHCGDWNIVPYFFKNIFKCKGRIRYVNVGKNKMKREIKGILKIDVPVLGKIAERVIIEHLIQNFEAEYNLTKKLLEEKKKKNC